ncbi:cytochrome c551 [Macrococcus equipercicus]|uniref:C-type cytochrome n=1 Tax=Macrococcus equipercicus TaxID=69967 RepID=A0A9Q9BRG0_9STAP|nr:cytochrome c [Macrococcus equipercicus]KAA1042456.1 c-type cytochrome [Macrococcus equipercicus]UTH14341.1 cytochrome c [Macrococcus equipercicus]
MKKQLSVVLIGSALLLAACGSETKTSDTSTSDPGKTAFQQNTCVGCHGRDMEGASGPNLQKVGSKYSKAEILNIIKNGKGPMPKGQAQGKEAEQIAAYLSKQK